MSSDTVDKVVVVEGLHVMLEAEVGSCLFKSCRWTDVYDTVNNYCVGSICNRQHLGWPKVLVWEYWAAGFSPIGQSKQSFATPHSALTNLVKDYLVAQETVTNVE